ncbi:MAG: hypothetical protein ACO3YY_00750 [Phycisphaerales bacterium]
MIVLLETDLPPAVAIPLAALLAVGCLWYWRRHDRRDVPESRRRIRRFSLLLILTTLPGLVWCSSLLDHRVDPQAYLVGWLACLMLLGVSGLTAGADVLDTLRLRAAEVGESRDAGVDPPRGRS